MTPDRHPADMNSWDAIPADALHIDFPGDDWIPLQAAAHIAGIPLKAMRRNADRRNIRTYKWYDGRRYIDREDLRTWMQRRKQSIERVRVE